MSIRDALVARAIEEWERFGKDLGRDDHFVDGERKETVFPYIDHVANYWLSIPSTQYNKLVKDHDKAKGKLDGATPLAWSAAFISYCFNMAGAGTKFPYSSGHATWIIKSISNKTAGKLTAPLVGFRLGKEEMQPGDLIGRPREDDADLTYDDVVAKGWFTSHSDIVVEVNKAKKKAYVIGGNVGQSVSKAEVNIDANGKLIDTDGWIVHIRNNI